MKLFLALAALAPTQTPASPTPISNTASVTAPAGFTDPDTADNAATDDDTTLNPTSSWNPEPDY